MSKYKGPRLRFTLRMTDFMMRRVQDQAYKEEKSVNDYIVDILTGIVDKEENP